MTPEQAVMMTAKIYECRESAKFMLGDKYAAKSEELQRAIVSVANKQNVREIEVLAQMCRHTDGFGQVMILAAYADLCEETGKAVRDANGAAP